MAFVPSIAIPTVTGTATRCQSSSRVMPSMAAQGYSRRAILRLAALGTVGVAGVALAANRKDDDFDLKELKKDVEELSYEEEVVEVGPDTREKNPTRIKKKEQVPEYMEEERDVLQKSDKKYDEMVAKEESDNERIKEIFDKKD